MISTVTTTVTTVATLIDGAALTAFGVFLLIGLLITKELARSSEGVYASRLAQAVNIGIFPMLFVFALIVLSKIQAVLQ